METVEINLCARDKNPGRTFAPERRLEQVQQFFRAHRLREIIYMGMVRDVDDVEALMVNPFLIR